MFNLFRKKEASIKVIDKVWVSQDAKFESILQRWKSDPEIVVVAWFQSTQQHLESMFRKETTYTLPLHLTREVHGTQLAGKKIIFAEHHPLRAKEQELFRQWQLKEAIVYSALDEPLFQKFGSEKIIQLMKQLGMQEDEVIEHQMVSSAIGNAQEKIEKKVLTEYSAASQKEWMERNLPA